MITNELYEDSIKHNLEHVQDLLVGTLSSMKAFKHLSGEGQPPESSIRNVETAINCIIAARQQIA